MLEFRRKMGQFAEALAGRGMDALITDAFRTFPEQDALFAKGRTTHGDVVTNARGGETNHNYGMAVDLYPVMTAILPTNACE
jgi:peptidoglycan L-alanyl-D-glutamate endopeptidase CwlK